VLTFLNWYGQTYPQFHHEAQVTIDYDIDGPRIKKLRLGPPARSVAQLQAMTVVM
jgi:hypothetical protein